MGTTGSIQFTIKPHMLTKAREDSERVALHFTLHLHKLSLGSSFLLLLFKLSKLS